MKPEAFTREAALAKVVVAWLTDLGWEVYQEVQIGTYSSVADIVATDGPRTCVVECKLSMGLRVLNQANDWLQSAHLVYVAVPRFIHGREDRFAYKIAALLGIGVLGVIPGASGSSSADIVELVHPAFRRRVHPSLRASLSEYQKTFAEAGNPFGKRWTPFQQTCQAVRDFAQQRPGAPLKEVIDGVKHHYSTPATARSTLARLIRAGVVPGLRIERLGNVVRVWPVGAEPR